MVTVEVKDKVYWVGAIDWDIRDFHGYSTPAGSTYNSYLMIDDRITLFDTVKENHLDQLLTRVGAVIDPDAIDYLVINHVEMDHTGALPEVLKVIKPEKIFCSKMGQKNLVDHFGNNDWPLEVVSSGQEVRVGHRTIHFIETRMLHWPDSMFSFIPEERLLISSDAFGQHWATSERFDDEVDLPRLMRHTAKYYANILLPYSALVQKLLVSLTEMGLEIDMIAPDHGLIWRGHIQEILQAYDSWSRHEAVNKALIIYDTMWHSTEKMAEAVALGLHQEGLHYKLMNAHLCHRSDIATEALDAKALIFGSATLNNGILPSMADVLCYLKGLRPMNKIGAAFGSYGWSGEAVKIMSEEMEKMKIEMVDPGVRSKYVPTSEVLEQCVELGRKVAQAVNQGLSSTA